MDGSDPAVAAALHGLNEERIVGRVAKRFAQPPDRAADALVKLHEDAFWPKRLAEFFPADDLSRTLDQNRKRPQRQVLDANLHPFFAEFARAKVRLEYSEANQRLGYLW